jgi:hypothetical protein
MFEIPVIVTSTTYKKSYVSVEIEALTLIKRQCGKIQWDIK